MDAVSSSVSSAAASRSVAASASSAASSLSVGTTSAQARWSLSRNNSRKSVSKYPSSTFSRRLAKTSSKRR